MAHMALIDADLINNGLPLKAVSALLPVSQREGLRRRTGAYAALRIDQMLEQMGLS